MDQQSDLEGSLLTSRRGLSSKACLWPWSGHSCSWCVSPTLGGPSTLFLSEAPSQHPSCFRAHQLDFPPPAPAVLCLVALSGQQGDFCTYKADQKCQGLNTRSALQPSIGSIGVEMPQLPYPVGEGSVPHWLLVLKGVEPRHPPWPLA